MNNNGLDLTYDELEILQDGLISNIEGIIGNDTANAQTRAEEARYLVDYTVLYAKLAKALAMKPVVDEEQEEDGQPTA